MVKNPPASGRDTRDVGLIPGSERSLGVRTGNPLLYSWPGKFHGWRSLVTYCLLGCKELDITAHTHTHTVEVKVCMFQYLKNVPIKITTYSFWYVTTTSTFFFLIVTAFLFSKSTILMIFTLHHKDTLCLQDNNLYDLV